MKKIPMRQCIGCMEKKEKKSLVRIVKNKQSEINVDITGKQNGRGAYICNDIECLKQAKKHKGLERVFERKIPEQIYIKLEEQLKNRG